LLRVNEIFKSIQGESSWVGYVFVFVRLTGCNLRCRYCDTKYAYDQGEEYSISQIEEKIGVYKCPRVEITGGEPLLQKDTYTLVKRLLDKNFIVLIETNGSLDVSKLDPRVIKIIDIKCPDSGEVDKVFWKNLEFLGPKDEIKFVINSHNDYIWARNIIFNKLKNKHNILLAPAFGKVELHKLAKWIMNDNLDIRLQPQLHKYIWPNKSEGV